MILRPFQVRDPHESHRASTPLELFFDLVCVVAIASLTAAFHHQIVHGHGLETIIFYFINFVGIWWLWSNFTWFASSYDNDDSLYRVLVFTMIGGYIIYAGGVSIIFEGEGVGLGIIGWIIMRISLILLWMRAAIRNPQHRGSAMIYIFGLGTLQVLWVLHYVLIGPEEPYFMQIGLGIMLLEIAVPLLASRFGHAPIHRHHMLERHGLLALIVMGEIILSASFFTSELFSGEIHMDVIYGAIATIVTVCTMWSFYFIDEDHIRATDTEAKFVSWGYMHVLVYFGAAMMGAAAAAQFDAMSHHSEAATFDLSAITFGALATFLLGVWLVRDSRLPGMVEKYIALVGVAACIVAIIISAPYWACAAIMLVTQIIRSLAKSPTAEPA